jgi:hypothetical protein
VWVEDLRVIKEDRRSRRNASLKKLFVCKGGAKLSLRAQRTSKKRMMSILEDSAFKPNSPAITAETAVRAFYPPSGMLDG